MLFVMDFLAVFFTVFGLIIAFTYLSALYCSDELSKWHKKTITALVLRRIFITSMFFSIGWIIGDFIRILFQ